MSRGRRRRSFSHFSLERLVAIWVAGLLGSFALGLYLFGLAASEPGKQSATETLPAEIAVSKAGEAPERR